MPQLVIENDDAPIGEKRRFYIHFEDEEEKQQAAELLDEIFSDPEDNGNFSFRTDLDSEGLKLQLIDDEVGEVIDYLSDEWPELEEAMENWQAKMLDELEQDD